MKKLVVALVLCFSQAFAADLQTHFDSLVKPSADQGEFTLTLSIDRNGSTGETLKEILSNLSHMEDIVISTIDVEYGRSVEANVERAIANLGLAQDGFFCSAFIDFQDDVDFETGKCGELVKALLTPFFATKGLFRAKAIYVEGNYYGDWIYSHLILETQEEVIVLDFDIVHEI